LLFARLGFADDSLEGGIRFVGFGGELSGG
jgi:hypothetical protein